MLNQSVKLNDGGSAILPVCAMAGDNRIPDMLISDGQTNDQLSGTTAQLTFHAEVITVILLAILVVAIIATGMYAHQHRPANVKGAMKVDYLQPKYEFPDSEIYAGAGDKVKEVYWQLSESVIKMAHKHPNLDFFIDVQVETEHPQTVNATENNDSSSPTDSPNVEVGNGAGSEEADVGEEEAKHVVKINCLVAPKPEVVDGKDKDVQDNLWGEARKLQGNLHYQRLFNPVTVPYKYIDSDDRHERETQENSEFIPLLEWYYHMEPEDIAPESTKQKDWRNQIRRVDLKDDMCRHYITKLQHENIQIELRSQQSGGMNQKMISHADFVSRMNDSNGVPVVRVAHVDHGETNTAYMNLINARRTIFDKINSAYVTQAEAQEDGGISRHILTSAHLAAKFTETIKSVKSQIDNYIERKEDHKRGKLEVMLRLQSQDAQNGQYGPKRMINELAELRKWIENGLESDSDYDEDAVAKLKQCEDKMKEEVQTLENTLKGITNLEDMAREVQVLITSLEGESHELKTTGLSFYLDQSKVFNAKMKQMRDTRKVYEGSLDEYLNEGRKEYHTVLTRMMNGTKDFGTTIKNKFNEAVEKIRGCRKNDDEVSDDDGDQ